MIPGAPSELRVFISSTFRDLQEERGYLMKHVFPEIRQRCRERGIEFTEIDLRWGLTHEEGSLGRIIRTCFEEIDKCRPFFIGMMGTRYGWLPQYLDIQKDPELLRRYPWIEDEVLEGASLLELEFMHGVLRYDGDMSGAYFYVRDSDAQGEAIQGSEAARIAGLKARLLASSRPVRSFHDVHSLGEHVRADMLAAIEHHWPLAVRSSRVAVERRGHEAFAAARRHAYIANPANIRLLNAHVADAGTPLLITAPSGLGKSALLAHWSNAYERKNPAAFVITHYVGSTPTGGSHADVIRRILAEIKERYGWSDPLPIKHDEIERTLPLWLARLQEPLVLVVDAVNQLDEDSFDLKWLPPFLPEQVRLVLSSTPGAVVDAARARGWEVAEIEPLTVPEREALIVRFLGEYHKGLSSDQLAVITHHPRCAIPLFLRTVLEELRLFGYFQELDAHILRYLSVQDLDELFLRVLQRLESDFTPGVVRAVLSNIWAARDGLTEVEIMALTGLSRAECSRLLIALDYHLIQRNGCRTFSHDYLRSATEARYIPSPSMRRDTHLQLGEFFATLPASARRAQEEPWQWQKAEAWDRLVGCLTNLSLFRVIIDGDGQYELAAYWRSVGTSADPVAAYQHAYEARSVGAADAVEEAQLPHLLGRFFMLLGKYAAAEPMFAKSAALWEAAAPAGPDLAKVLDDQTQLYYVLNKLDEAEAKGKTAFALRTQLSGDDDPLTIESLVNLGAIMHARGLAAEAEAHFTEARRRAERSGTARAAQRAVIINNLAAVVRDRGDGPGTIALLDEAVGLISAELGPEHADLVPYLTNLGVMSKYVKEYDRAAAFNARALALSTKRFGPTHWNTARILMNMASLAFARADYVTAEQMGDVAAASIAEALGEQHVETWRARLVLAEFLIARENMERALTLIEAELPRYMKAAGVDMRTTKSARDMIAILERQGKADELASWRKRFTDAGIAL